MAAPCDWTLDTSCCSDFWATLTAEQQAGATAVATQVIWAATGRQFGSCPVTVRPCGNNNCDDMIGGWWWVNGVFTPYILGDEWFNCACPGICSCGASCKVMLPGPIESVTQVAVNGAIIDPAAYRVDDGIWLVRTDGDCWPESQNFDVDSGDNTFFVSYNRGTPVPAALAAVAGSYACEWAKGCQGSDCKLPSRIVTLTRQDVIYEFQNIDELLSAGLTGVPEWDIVIRSYNPYGATQRYRVFSPELDGPIMTTVA